MKIEIKVLAARHVKQLPLEHYWPWESRFDFGAVIVHGRMAETGNVLCQDKKAAARLRLISAGAFIDWAFAECGGILPNGDYAPTPHTPYMVKARERYEELPQLFTDDY